MKFRRSAITAAAAMSAAASLTFVTAAQAAPGIYQATSTDLRNDVKVMDKNAPNLKRAKALADARGYDIRNADGDGATFKATFRIDRLAKADESMQQYVYLYYTDGRNKKAAGDILVNINDKTVMITPSDTEQEYCGVDATTNRKKKTVTFKVDPACFAVTSARFHPFVGVEHGPKSTKRKGTDIAYDRMKMTPLINLSN